MYVQDLHIKESKAACICLKHLMKLSYRNGLEGVFDEAKNARTLRCIYVLSSSVIYLGVKRCMALFAFFRCGEAGYLVSL